MDGRHLLESVLDEFLAQQLAERIENNAVANAEEEVERSGHDALWRNGQEGTLLWVMGVAVCWSAVARGVEEIGLQNDADGTRMRGGWSHETEDSVDEGPVTIEKGAVMVDEMLQHGPDVRKSSGVADERRQALGTAVLQFQPTVASFIREKRSKVLCRFLRVGWSGRGSGVGDAENATAAACVTADCKKGRLRTQNRHKAKGIGEIRSTCECACLGGMCRCKLLLTVDHRLLAGDVKGRHRADLLSNGSREVDQFGRRGCRRRMDGVEWHADLLEDFSDGCLCLFLSLPSLRRLEGVVRALLPRRSDSRQAGWRRRRRETDASFLCLAARCTGSPDSTRTMVLHVAEPAAAILTQLVAARVHSWTCPAKPG